jgi:hypothetical protein
MGQSPQHPFRASLVAQSRKKRFDSALQAAFVALGLSAQQLLALRQPFLTDSGLVKWRPFADVLMQRNGVTF